MTVDYNNAPRRLPNEDAACQMDHPNKHSAEERRWKKNHAQHIVNADDCPQSTQCAIQATEQSGKQSRAAATIKRKIDEPKTQ
jgi:hypothetical protein